MRLVVLARGHGVGGGGVDQIALAQQRAARGLAGALLRGQHMARVRAGAVKVVGRELQVALQPGHGGRNVAAGRQQGTGDKVL